MLASDIVATGTAALLSADAPSSAPIPPSAAISSSFTPSFHSTTLHPSASLCVRALVADGATGAGMGLGLVGALHNDLPQQLERCGFDVVTAGTVTEAVEQFKQSVCELPANGVVQQGNRFEEKSESAGSKQQVEAGRQRLLEGFGDEPSSLSGQWAASGEGEERVASSDKGVAADAREAGSTPGAPFSLVVMELEAMAHDGFACIRSIRDAEGRRQGWKARNGEECSEPDADGNQFPRPAAAEPDADSCFSGAEANTEQSTSAATAGAVTSPVEAAALGGATGVVASDSLQEEPGNVYAVPRTVVIAVANMNRWDLAGLDQAMQQCMHAGVDAVVPRTMNLQQLKSVLRKLGVRGKYVLVPNSLPRAMSGAVHNPLNLSR
ncbi:unnamed protein product [Closterium sp. Yama58-4]|nr:unnamed protein product [Closterium sp. Yama58-4]